MEVIQSAKPLYAVLVSLAAVILIGLSGKKPNLRETWTVLAALAKLGLVVSMLPAVLNGKTLEYLLVQVLPGLEIAFKVDALGMSLALTASFLWVITSFYAMGYMRAHHEHAQTRFFMCFAVALSAAAGAAFSANIFTLLAFYEILTLCTYPLVAHHETGEAIKGARRYLAYLLGTSIFFLLPAVFLTYYYAGTLDFVPGGILAGKAPAGILAVIFILYIAGTAKAALMPFHRWLPSAMVAPTPVSALLHAVAVVKVGVFTVLRVILFVFGVDLLAELQLGTVLAYLAAFTIIAASVIALRQDNLKLRLAYSTVSQLSYIILGAALLVPAGVTGSIMHITIHALGKITLFFTAGAILVAAHKTNISELDGIGKKMPFTMAAFTAGALSMIAMPPLGGFVSKWYLLLGAVEASQYPLVLVLILSTMLNAGYYLPIVHRAFFRGEGRVEIQEAPAAMVIPIMLTGAGVLGIFFASPLLEKLVSLVIAGAL